MKLKLRYSLVYVGAISIIIVCFFLLPPRWSYIILGTLALVIGSVALTEEWKTGKRVGAVIFVIAIAVGGLLTTKGWNEWGDYSQKKALTVGLAREWMVNELYQHKKPLDLDPNDPNAGDVHYSYPRFKTFALNSVLTSNLFDLRHKDDRELNEIAINYESFATSCNTMFNLLDSELTHNGTTKEHRKEQYSAVINYSPLYSNFKRWHEAMGKVLKEKYSWALKEAMLLIDEKSQKELREKYKWLSEESLNNKNSK
jgi:hypothetical protein